MRHRFGWMVVFVALAAAAPLAPLAAQNVSGIALSDSTHIGTDSAKSPASDVTSSPSKSVTGASLIGLRAGVHMSETARPARPTAQATHANLGQARAMMVVGVAGLIAGAIIGGSPGTIVMVGGAVIGLLGLYDYLQ